MSYAEFFRFDNGIGRLDKVSTQAMQSSNYDGASPHLFMRSLYGPSLPSSTRPVMELNNKELEQWIVQLSGNVSRVNAPYSMPQHATSGSEMSPIPLEVIVNYTDHYDKVESHKQEIEMQHRLEKMRSQYEKYQKMLDYIQKPSENKKRRVNKMPFSAPNMEACPTRLSLPEPCISGFASIAQAYNSHPGVNYAITKQGVPHYVLQDASLTSADTTPDNAERHSVLSTGETEASSCTCFADNTLRCCDVSSDEGHGLISMSSFSTVSSIGDDAYGTMKASVPMDDFDNKFLGMHGYPASLIACTTALSPDVIRRYRKKVFVDRIMDMGSMRFPSHDERILDDSLSLDIAPVSMVNRGIAGLRANIAGNLSTLPVIDGQINHDYYRRDFFARALEQGTAHLFTGLDVVSPTTSSPSTPIPLSSSKVVSCSSDQHDTNGGKNEGSTQKEKETIDNGISSSSSGLAGRDSHDMGVADPEDSDDEDVPNIPGSSIVPSRRCREECDESDEEGTRTVKRKIYGVFVDQQSSNSSYTEADDPDASELGYAELARTLKALDVGGVMIISKRRSHRDSHIYVKKSTKSYDYLLDIPATAGPDPALGEQQYKCIVPGVYWDKRSWIASWYDRGNRCYSSFSAKMHGFYKAKYFAIHVRMYKTRVNTKPIDEAAVERERRLLMKYFEHRLL